MHNIFIMSFFLSICFSGIIYVTGLFFLLFLISLDSNLSILLDLVKNQLLDLYINFTFLFLFCISFFLGIFFIKIFFLMNSFLLFFLMAILFLLFLYLNLDTQLIFVHSSLIIKAYIDFNFPGSNFKHIPYILMYVVVIIKQSMTRV